MRPRPLLPTLVTRSFRGPGPLWIATAALAGGVAAALPAQATDLTGADGPPLMPPQRVEVPLTGATALARPHAARTTVEVDTQAPAWRPGLDAQHDAAPPDTLDDRAGLAGGVDGGRVGVHVVRWAPAGAAGQLGVSVGFSGAAQSLHAPMLDQLPGSVAPTWQPELGVRWRSDWRGQHRLDVAAWRTQPTATGTDDDALPAYNARVELQFRDAKRALGFDLPHGALGLQLRGSSRLLLRASHGGPMLYYRNQW